MDFLKTQLKQIGEQLRGMSNSQRVAVVLSLVIALAGVWGMFTWAGGSEWVPVLDQPLTGDQIQRIESALLVADIQTKIADDRVMIRGDRDARRRAEALLAQSDALPRDTTRSYDSLIKNENPFTGNRKEIWKERRGLEYELSAVLREFPGVKHARVLLTLSDHRSFKDRGKASSASVAMTMADGRPIPKKQVVSVAQYVAGAAGLKVGDVKITDGSRFYRPPDDADAMPTEQLELQRQFEDRYARKIYDQLRHIAGVVVNVHATLRTTAEQIQESTVGKPRVSKEKTRTEEMSGGGGAVGPGVRPNTGRALANAGTGQTSTKEETETIFEGETDRKTSSKTLKAGHLERLTASVSVPRSYLEQIVKAEDNIDPVKPPDIERKAKVVLARIRDRIKPLLDATADEQVVVDWYYDATPSDAPAASAGSEPIDYIALAKDYGPQVVLGLFALFSVLTVIRMAKKSGGVAGGPVPAGAGIGAAGDIPMVGEGGERPLSSLGGVPLAVGEAEEIGGVLEGQEVDEDAVRTQQIVKQIGAMVREDPQVAASLLERWIDQSR